MLTQEEFSQQESIRAIVKKPKRSLFRLMFFLVVVSAFFGAIAGGFMSYFFAQQLILRFENFQNDTTNQFEMSVVEDSATVQVVESASPSVVSIVVSKDAKDIYNTTGHLSPFDYLYEPQVQPDGKQEIGSGTGFVISSDGVILTNKHVVFDEKAEYAVVTNEGKRYDAHVLGMDPVNDLALLKVDTEESLTAISLGDSSTVHTGQTVIAIGNSLGRYANSVTKGVISGIGRKVIASGSAGFDEVIDSAIQTDAAINPGNSGGPLLDLYGNVIGVNTAISYEGQLVGFAIPINDAKKIIISYQKYGRIVRPYLGVRYVVVDSYFATLNAMSIDYGALVIAGSDASELAVQKGSPAQTAGLVEGDIILEVEGKRIDKDNDLARVVSGYSPGDTLNLKVYHEDKEITLQVTLAEFPN